MLEFFIIIEEVIMKYIKNIAAIFAISAFTALTGSAQGPEAPTNPKFDAELAKKLGADDMGMKNFVLVILKTGPRDADFKGEERSKIFAGHFANINKLASEGKLAVAGPFGKNEKAYRGLYIFNVATVDEAEKLVVTDPAVKAGILVPDLTPWYGSAALMQVTETHGRIAKKSF